MPSGPIQMVIKVLLWVQELMANLIYTEISETETLINSPSNGYQRHLQIVCSPVPPSKSYHDTSPEERFRLFKIIGYECWRPSPETLDKKVGLLCTWDTFLFKNILENTCTWEVWYNHFSSKIRSYEPALLKCYLVYDWKEQCNMPIYISPLCQQPGTLRTVLDSWYPLHMQNVTLIYEYEDPYYQSRAGASRLSPMISSRGLPSSSSELPTLNVLLAGWKARDTIMPSSPPKSHCGNIIPSENKTVQSLPNISPRLRSLKSLSSAAKENLKSPASKYISADNNYASSQIQLSSPLLPTASGENSSNAQRLASNLSRIPKRKLLRNRQCSSASYIPSRIVGEHNMTTSQLSWLKRRRTKSRPE